MICTKCDKVSNQYENMMDLTVEIHGDASSLEECLNQYTTKEWLHGENMYKCDGYGCISFPLKQKIICIILYLQTFGCFLNVAVFCFIGVMDTSIFHFRSSTSVFHI